MAQVIDDKKNEALAADLAHLRATSDKISALQTELEDMIKEGTKVRLQALDLIDKLKISKVKNYIQTN
ncbi:MAG: hypothetical protein WC457_00130 [Patescibacteria group bacterium]